MFVSRQLDKEANVVKQELEGKIEVLFLLFGQELSEGKPRYLYVVILDVSVDVIVLVKVMKGRDLP